MVVTDAVTGIVSVILSAMTDVLSSSDLIQAILSFLDSLGFVLLIVKITYIVFYGPGSLFFGNLDGVLVYATNIVAGIWTFSFWKADSLQINKAVCILFVIK